MSISKQCKLLGVPHSSYYYRSQKSPDNRLEDELLMQVIDRIYTEEPVFGTRRMRNELRKIGYAVGRRRIRRLMRVMDIVAIYPKPRLSDPHPGHKIYPYLLRDMEINRSDQVWCTDITYIPLGNTHVYLTAVMDWHSRYIISWKLSNSLDKAFCIEALEEALAKEPAPEIFNTDQGSQFTSEAFTKKLKDHQIKISMDGKGRALDNRMIERFWRSVKYDDIYIRGYENMTQLRAGINRYIEKYNNREHQGLDERTPTQVYQASKPQLQNAA